MLDYNKVKKKISKAFPDLTEEEVEKMAFEIPAHIPLPAVDGLIQLTKVVSKTSGSLDKLKNAKSIPAKIKFLLKRNSTALEGEENEQSNQVL